MIIYLATDHAGFQLKEAIKKFLIKKGYQVKDCGAFKYNPEDDYPDFIRLAAKAVSKCGPSAGHSTLRVSGHSDSEKSSDSKNSMSLGQKCRAVIFGGSGQGEAMVANRYKNVRAAVYYGKPDKIIKLSREHNDANVLSLGARFLKEPEAIKAVELWLRTPFFKEARHERRIKKLR